MHCSIQDLEADSYAITRHIYQCNSKTSKMKLQKLFSEKAEKLSSTYSKFYHHSLILQDFNPKATFPSFTSLVEEINSSALNTLGLTEKELPKDIQTYFLRNQTRLR